MQPKELIDTIKEAVQSVKAQNQDILSIDAMNNYLDSLKRDIDGSEEINQKSIETDIAIFRAEHERNLAHYEAQQLHNIELFRSVIAYGQGAVKSAILINGGAAVAMLAFIGNIWSKGVATEAVGSLTSAIAFFAYGVLVAALGTASSYLTQYSYSEYHHKTGIFFHVFSVVLVLLAFALFGFGSFESYQAFIRHLGPS